MFASGALRTMSTTTMTAGVGSAASALTLRNIVNLDDSDGAGDALVQLGAGHGTLAINETFVVFFL